MRLVEQHCTSHSSPCLENTGMNGSFGKFVIFVRKNVVALTLPSQHFQPHRLTIHPLPLFS